MGSEASKSGASEKAEAGEAPASNWPWVFLALWVALIFMLAYLGRHEWWTPRPNTPGSEQESIKENLPR